MIEFGAVLDDLEDPKPIKDLPKYRCLFKLGNYFCEHYALLMHIKNGLWQEIYDAKISDTNITDPSNYYVVVDNHKNFEPNKFERSFRRFLIENNYLDDTKIRINVAGKNFSGFDKKFIDKWTELDRYVRIDHRVLDPTFAFLEIADKYAPGLATCFKRIGVKQKTAHTSVDDAIDVIRLIRYCFDIEIN